MMSPPMAATMEATPYNFPLTSTVVYLNLRKLTTIIYPAIPIPSTRKHPKIVKVNISLTAIMSVAPSTIII